MNKSFYSPDFYNLISNWSESSAKQIIPVLFDFVKPNSVIDVGCGDGTWLRCFLEAGVKRIFGLDGTYVSEDLLKIDPNNFQPCDLENPPDIHEKFDLAICLEVAEHLNETSSPKLVSFLTQLSDFVLFSAAIPLQSGVNHINTHWQDYWSSQFRSQGYLPILTLRSRIWNDSQIAFFYRQNIILYIKESVIQSSFTLTREYEKSSNIPIAVVHPECYLFLAEEFNQRQKKSEMKFIDLIIDRFKRRFKHLLSSMKNAK